MEGQDGDHQHNHRSTLDRECTGVHGTRVFGQVGRTGRKRSGYGAGRVNKLSRLRRSSTVTDIFDANVTIAKQKGAPVEWRPLEPVVTTVGSSALMAKAPNPHTALLFIDFLLSKEGQQLILKGGLWSPREDVGSLDQKFKKNYLDEKYSLEELEAKFAQWENLMRQLFIRKR